jgi:hypothetical protein
VNWGAGTRNLRCGWPAALAFPGTVARAANTILGVADHGKTIIATGTWTQTLDAAATLGDGWSVNYRNDGTGVITLDPNGAETIDGGTTLDLPPGASCTIVCNGTALKTIGLTGKKGTFTPTLTFGGAAVGMTFSARSGAYIKIGNIVFFNLSMTLSAKGSSAGAAVIGGLPVTSDATFLPPITIWADVMAAGTTTMLTGLVVNSSTNINLSRYAAGAISPLGDPDFTNTSNLSIEGWYFT